MIPKYGVKNGDRLLLTKPVGLQPIMAAYRILKDIPEMLDTYSEKQLKKSIKIAVKIMTTSNQKVVETIHSFEEFSFIHAMTDVTGFGFAGHLSEMLQNSNLSALIEIIPSIKLSEELANDLGYAFDECKCSETAGGMLMAIDPENINEFSERLARNGIDNWIVGRIDKETPDLVRISRDVRNIEISKY
jgi:selenide,water dikinase